MIARNTFRIITEDRQLALSTTQEGPDDSNPS
jgi:hypothetical protein